MHLLLLIPFLVFVNADVACIAGDTEFDGYCYQFVNQRLQYSDAQNYCSSQGGVIVRIRGDADGRWLASTAATKFHATYGNYWIGFHRENGQFVWDDGQKPDYLNWASGSPFSGYDYVGAQLSNTKWVTVLSSQTLPFICYYQKGRNRNQLTTPLPTQSLAGICDGAELLLGHRCYFFNPTLLPYEHAKKACAFTGKTLAIFDDISQINFVTSTAISKFSMNYGSFWIGLQKNEDDGKFYWPDGSADSLHYWTRGYPFQHQKVVSQQVSDAHWRTSETTALLPTVCSGYMA